MCLKFPMRECLEDVSLNQFAVPSSYFNKRDHFPFLENQFLLSDFERYLLEVIVGLLPPSPYHMPDAHLEAIFYFLNCKNLGLQLNLIDLWATYLAETFWSLQNLSEFFVFRFEYLLVKHSRFFVWIVLRKNSHQLWFPNRKFIAFREVSNLCRGACWSDWFFYLQLLFFWDCNFGRSITQIFFFVNNLAAKELVLLQ